MSARKSSFGCFAGAIGLIIILAFVAFIGAISLMARAEKAFGPPTPALNSIQRVRLGVELGWRAQALQRPLDPDAAGMPFNIGVDEPTSEIVQRMQEAGLIREASLFSAYLIYTGLDTQLQAGYYLLSPAMNAPQLAESLIDPTPETVTLVILPGWRLEEIAAALPSAGVAVSPEDFLLASWSPSQTFIDLPAGISLEGYVLPGSYEIVREYDAPRLINTLVADFYDYVTEDLIAAFETQGLTLHEAVTLASIIERESVIDDEMPLFASVFLNRLNSGLSLEADPTVQYALGYGEASGSWWKTPLTSADLQIDSRYNTYLYPGLPPGPIAAPSLDSLHAVAYPESTPYFFFQAACDGSGRHIFAITFEEHLANNCP